MEAQSSISYDAISSPFPLCGMSCLLLISDFDSNLVLDVDLDLDGDLILTN